MKSNILKSKLWIVLILFFVQNISHAQSNWDFAVNNDQGQMLCYTIIDSIQHTVSVKGNAAYTYFGVLIIPDSVIHDSIKWDVVAVGDSAFRSQYDITEVVIPNTIGYIGKFAFSWCGIENGLTVPSSVESIGYMAFNFINNVVYQGTAEGSPWGALAVNAYSEDSIFYADSTKRVLLSSHLNLSIANIGQSTDTIDCYAFYNCYRLRDVVFPNGLKYIGREIFPTQTVKALDIVIPRTVVCIDDQAFRSANIRSLTINNASCTIGRDAFGYCDNLQSVDLGDSVLYIGTGAFQCCRRLTEFTIPQSVTGIGDSLFCYSWNLKHVTLPATLDSIKHSTFRGCSSLRDIIIPSTVNHIGEFAFLECGSLQEITSLNPIPPSASDSSFYLCNANGIVYVPCGSSSAYASDPHWSYFNNIEEDCDGIEESEPDRVRIFSIDNTLSICGAQGESVYVFDVVGRQIFHTASASDMETVKVPSVGVYIVKVGNSRAKKIVAIK